MALQPRAKGVKFGRPRLINDKLVTEALALKESGITVPEIARRQKLGVSTTYRLLAEARRVGRRQRPANRGQTRQHF